MTEWTPERLIAFEQDIADRFNRGEIPYPVHLDGGNEQPLINYFNEWYRKGDWVIGTWRMHYKCLLAGVPEDELRQAILDGHSITLCFPEYRIYSTALVGHCCSIAMGVAKELNGSGIKAHCFLGDMAANTGDYYEAKRYSDNHGLPLQFIVEDNGKSVTTDTRKAWGTKGMSVEHFDYLIRYKPTWPHQGTGKRVEF